MKWKITSESITTFFFPVVFFVAPNVSRNEKVTKTKSFENLFFNNEMKDYFWVDHGSFPVVSLRKRPTDEWTNEQMNEWMN